MADVRRHLRTPAIFLPLLLIWFGIFLSVITTTSASSQFYYILIPKVLFPEAEHNVEVFVKNHPGSILYSVMATEPSSKASKPAGVNQVLRKGSGTAKLKVPFEKIARGFIYLNFTLVSCGSVSDVDCRRRPGGAIIANHSAEVPVIKHSFHLFAETDKPIYKPNDNLRFRLLPLYSDSLRPTNNSGSDLMYDLIYLESPSKQRMSQWRNVSWLNALKGFSFPLSADPEYGKWKVVAMIGGQKGEDTLEVKKYVLPQFTVELYPPSFLLGNARTVKYSVCAKYSTGLPMRASVVTTFSLQGYKDNRPFIRSAGRFDGQKTCIQFIESTRSLDLQNSYFYSRQIILNATVTEEGTGAQVTKSGQGGSLAFNMFIIKIDSGSLFYRQLPYYGRVRTLNPDNTPYPNARIKIRLNNWNWNLRWGYLNITTSDQDGVANFVIPPIPTTISSLSLTISSADYEAEPYVRGRQSMFIPIISKTLSAAYSPSNTSLRINPFYNMAPQDPCASGFLKLQLASNVRLFTRKIHVVVTARGQIMGRMLFERETNSRLRECQDADNSEYGHYRCHQSEGTDRGFKVICLRGWRGENCFIPLCRQRCEKGICGYPGRCICQEGWEGEHCTVCMRKWGCQYGSCSVGNDCKCYRGWTGQYCSERTAQSSSLYYTGSYNRRVPCLHNCLETNPIHYVYDPNRIETANIFRREIRVPWSYNMSPSATIIVYFEYNNTEIVSDSIEISNLTLCMQKAAPTSFNFSSTKVRPGTNLTGKISTSGNNATCALSIIDIAMDAFGSTGVSYAKVLEEMKKLMTIIISQQHNPDYYQTRTSHLCNMEKDRLRKTRVKRMVMPGWGYFHDRPDSSRAFKEGGVIILSNIEVITKPCDSVPVFLYTLMEMDEDAPGIAESSSADKSTSITTEKAKETVRPKVRTLFPESWKFELLNGTLINLTAPDSMTTWRANMYCVSSRGLGISPPASLKVFQPFFIQMVLPYSLIRGEVATLPIKIFNYVNACYEVTLKLDSSDDFTIIGHQFEEVCICGFERKTSYIKINATVLKTIPLQVTAIPRTSSSGICNRTATTSSTSVPNLVGDAVRRQLLVEPEGLPQEISVGDVICASTLNKTMQLNLDDIKDDLVPDSARAYLSWSGDILGPALDNLERLVRMPYGCGEQNMASLVPNIFVLDYFTKSGIEKKDVKAKALLYIDSGYKRQLRYRYPDGSYSSFVRKGGKGSTWLTAFVLKSFAMAQKYVSTIDTDVLIKATNFLLSKQNRATGCIREDGRVYSRYLKGGMSSASDQATMTAFVLSCFIESKDNTAVNRLLGNAITRAVSCIENATPSTLTSLNAYDIALRTYALTRWNKTNTLTQRYDAEFRRREVNIDGLRYVPEFNAGRRRPSYFRRWCYYTAADVEITAYLVRTLFHKTATPRLIDLLPYLRWLIRQRNELGGWYSTQDTVLALNALSEAATLMTGSSSGAISLDMTIKPNDSSVPITYQLRPNNKLLFNRRTVGANTSFRINVTGNGCIIVQLNLLFNSKNFDKHARVSPFSARASVVPTNNACTKARISVCMKYTPPTPGAVPTMILMKTKMASGWTSETASIASLQSSTPSQGLNLVEVEKDKSVVLYYDSNATSFQCSGFIIEREVEVEDVKPMILQVYDYYQPEQVAEVNVPVYTGSCQNKGRFTQNMATTTSSTTCGVCAGDQSGVLNALREKCKETTYSVVLAERDNIRSSSWTFRFKSFNGVVLGWTNTLNIRSGCSCDMDRAVILIALHRNRPQPGKPITVDGGWLVINPSHVRTTYGRLSSICQRKWSGFPFAIYKTT